MAQPKPASPTTTHYLADLSGGMNFSTARQAIKDNEAWWLEGVQPIGPGNLAVLKHATATVATINEGSEPTYSLAFQAGGVDLEFVVFSASGHGYVGVQGVGYTLVLTGLTSGTTCACQWNKLGVLIIDPTGYWDWNVTTASAITALAHSVQSVSVLDPGSGYTAVPTVTFAGGGGGGAAATAYLGVGRAVVNAGGLGYNVGDVVEIPGTGSVSTTSIQVTAVSAAGAATAVQVLAAGQYVTGGLPAAVAAGTVGGAGNGLTLDTSLNVSVVTVTLRGSNYNSLPTATLVGGGPARVGILLPSVSGFLGGTAIAAYAGRSWVANGRTVTFSDAGTYASFVGSGSQFTIDDSYLLNNITALFAANNYLYIFGDTSIDVLSNVTVTSADTASFSRVNVSPVIGCSRQQTIFPYYRSIAFANSTGFYMMTGATVDSISEGKLENIMATLTPSRTFGFPVTLNGQLCAAWAFQGTDLYAMVPVVMHAILIFGRGRWWMARQAITSSTFLELRCPTAIGSSTQGFIPYAWSDSNGTSVTQYSLFSNAGIQVWRIASKLFDMGDPMFSKQPMRMGMGYTTNGTTPGTGYTFGVDSEYGAGANVAIPAAVTNGYNMTIGYVTGTANAKYIGYHHAMAATDSSIARMEWMAMEFTETNPWQ